MQAKGSLRLTNANGLEPVCMHLSQYITTAPYIGQLPMTQLLFYDYCYYYECLQLDMSRPRARTYMHIYSTIIYGRKQTNHQLEAAGS